MLTKPPIDTACPLTNQMLLPTQQAFRQNQGGYVCSYSSPMLRKKRRFRIDDGQIVFPLYRFIKLKITNPLNVAIPGPIVVTYKFPGGTQGPVRTK